MQLKYRTTFGAHICSKHERNFIYTFRRSSAYSWMVDDDEHCKSLEHKNVPTIKRADIVLVAFYTRD